MGPSRRGFPGDRGQAGRTGGYFLTRYLLDTNIISDLVRNPAGQAAQQLLAVGDENVCTSIIVASELRYGCAKKGSARLQQRVEEVLALIPVLPLEAPADV